MNGQSSNTGKAKARVSAYNRYVRNRGTFTRAAARLEKKSTPSKVSEGAMLEVKGRTAAELIEKARGRKATVVPSETFAPPKKKATKKKATKKKAAKKKSTRRTR